MMRFPDILPTTQSSRQRSNGLARSTNVSDDDELINVADTTNLLPRETAAATSTANGYEEFFNGVVTCPSCQGTGKVPRTQEHELVVLIPISDKRLRPRRTVLYVSLAVFICAVIGALLLFFLFPRSVLLESKRPTLTPTYIGVNETDKLSITVTNRYNLTNNNYVSVEVRLLEVKMGLSSQTIISQAENSTVVKVPMRSSVQHYIKMNATLTDEYIVAPCKKFKGRLLIVPFQATATFYYYDKEEQSTLLTYQYIRCHPSDMNQAPYAEIIIN